MPQLQIQNEPALGLPGQNAYPFMLTERDSNVVFGSVIPHGLLVVRQAEDVVRLPAAAGDIVAALIRGVILRDPTEEFNAAGWAIGKVAPVMRRGYVWVYSETAATQGAPVFARHAAGAGGTQLGSFRADADAGTATLVPNFHFYRSAAAPGMAIIAVRV